MIFSKHHLKYFYQVVRRRINKPMANSIQYFLQND